MNDQKCDEKIEQEISDQIVIWIKSNPKVNQTEIKNKIIQEIRKRDYLKEDWQIYYAKERIMIFIKERLGVNFNYAGFSLRLIAFIIDQIVIVGIVFLMAFLVGLFLGIISFQENTWNIIGVGIAWIYYASMESSQTQGTFGKMALGIKVTNLDGNRISFSRATVRFFGKIISSIFCIGYLMITFTEKKQGLHDKIAACLVVKKSKKMIERIEKENFQKNNQEHNNESLQKVIQHEEKNIEIKKSKKRLVWSGIILVVLIITIISIYNSPSDNDQDILLEKTDKSSEYSERVGNLYRNTKYKFRIKFPEGWDIKSGDGPNIIQKAVKGNNSISIGVREISAEYSDEAVTIKDAMSLVEFKDSFSGKEFQENFPGSELLDYGETKLDNKATYWVKYSAPYSALDINVEGIILQYQLLHKNIAYFITAGTLSNEFNIMESELKKSIATFVIEDY